MASLKMTWTAAILAAALLPAACGAPPPSHTSAPAPGKIVMTDEEWRAKLTPEEYHVLREKGTEPRFSGAYSNTKKDGTYACAGCGQPLFRSETKYDSRSGWPSFWAPIGKDRVDEVEDRGSGEVRTEILCSRCGGHLGHVFDDGPAPTGLRYCVNSAALELREKEED